MVSNSININENTELFISQLHESAYKDL